MPLPIAAAAAVAGRKAALSATRKGVGGVKRKTKQKIGTAKKSTTTSSRKEIGWVEVIFVTLLLALPNDLLDAIKATGVGEIITLLVEPLTLGLLFFWFLFRVGESPQRKILKNGLVAAGEALPFFGMLPLWTLLVINVKTGWFDPLLNLPGKIFKI